MIFLVLPWQYGWENFEKKKMSLPAERTKIILTRLRQQGLVRSKGSTLPWTAGSASKFLLPKDKFHFSKRGMKPGTRTLKKYVIFPCCLLIFGAVEEVVVYKSTVIANDHLRVAAMMFFYAFGIALIAFVLTPALEKGVLRIHAVSKVGAGRLGEYAFVAVLLAGVYYLWYRILLFGPETLLPATWR